MIEREMAAEPTVRELEQLWDAHWAKRRGRDPHSKLGSFRYDSALELLPAQESTLLDVSGGDGAFAFLARERHSGCRITVVDRSRAAAAICAERGFASALADLDESGLPFATGTFDVVTSLSVLQDLMNPWRLLEEMTRVSRRWLLISCPNFASISNRSDLLFGNVPRQMTRKTHLRFVTYSEVRRRLEGEGFRVVACRTRMKLPLLRSMPRIPGLGKPRLLHRLFPNWASKFTILAERAQEFRGE